MRVGTGGRDGHFCGMADWVCAGSILRRKPDLARRPWQHCTHPGSMQALPTFVPPATFVASFTLRIEGNRQAGSGTSAEGEEATACPLGTSPHTCASQSALRDPRRSPMPSMLTLPPRPVLSNRVAERTRNTGGTLETNKFNRA